MTPEQFARVESLFEEAINRPAEVRSAWLRDACADDEVVRRKVEGMLSADGEAESQLETPAMGVGFSVADVDAGERRLREEFAAAGRYVLHAFIGEGGFGSVYRAEQLQPVRRPVAIKVIKLGMDTRRVLARFELERQTLAIMNHPGIAKVFDAGMTPSGRPYVAMELVDGRAITTYCEEKKLDARGRLELFVRTCEAVRHAHQKGVLHRDIKPSNVLVSNRDGHATPVIIDFGIARAVSGEEAEVSRVTEHGQMIGTLEYMSPEQARGDVDIDTRADIYALGTLLYRLLTGSTPIERATIDRSAPHDIRRLICDTDPPAPSVRVRSIPRGGGDAEGGAIPSVHSRELRGDLDVIVMKAIAKERSRRYETVDALAQDVLRFLRNEAVLARPATATYRFTRFARRHRGALAAAVGMFVLLIGGVIGTTAGMLRARHEAQVARNETEIAKAVTDFLNNDLLAAVSPDELGNDARMRDVVDAAAKRVGGRFRDQPRVEAAVRLTLGRTYMKLADLAAAEKNLERCLALRTNLLGAEAIETLEAEYELAQVYLLVDRNADGEKLLRHVYERRRSALGESDAATIASLYQYGVAIAEQGRLNEAEPILVTALADARTSLGEGDPLTLRALRGVGVLYQSMGKDDIANRHFEQAVRATRDALGLENDATLLAIRDYSTVLIDAGRATEAEAMLAEAIPVSRRIRGESHPGTLMMMDELARALALLGEKADAESQFRSALALAEKSLPEGHSVITRIQISLARFLQSDRRYDEAETLLISCATSRARALGPDHPWTQDAIRDLLALYQAAGMPQRAEEWRQRLMSPEHFHADHASH